MLNTTDKIIKHKTGLLNLAEELGNVSKACQVMGMSRDTFYRYKSAVEDARTSNGGCRFLVVELMVIVRNNEASVNQVEIWL